MVIITPVILFYDEDLSHKNSVYYQDYMTIQKEDFIPDVKECVEYVKLYPNATGQNIVFDLTATPAEKLLDKQFGQISQTEHKCNTMLSLYVTEYRTAVMSKCIQCVEENPDTTDDYIESALRTEHVKETFIKVFGEPTKTRSWIGQGRG